MGSGTFKFVSCHPPEIMLVRSAFSWPKAISAGLDRDNRRRSGNAILTGILRLRTVPWTLREITR